jgi:hypothetical protein
MEKMMKQMMERLLAENKATQEEIKANQHETKADRAEFMARMGRKMDDNKEEMKYAINSLRSIMGGAIKTRVEMMASRGVTRLFGGGEGTNSRRDRSRGGAPGSPYWSNGRGGDWSSRELI